MQREDFIAMHPHGRLKHKKIKGPMYFTMHYCRKEPGLWPRRRITRLLLWMSHLAASAGVIYCRWSAICPEVVVRMLQMWFRGYSRKEDLPHCGWHLIFHVNCTHLGKKWKGHLTQSQVKDCKFTTGLSNVVKNFLKIKSKKSWACSSKVESMLRTHQ